MTGTRLPTMDQCVDIIGQQITKTGKARQLSFIAETQGKEFAQKVHDKAKAAGKLGKK